MSVPFRIHVALEHQDVEPGRGKIWGVIEVAADGPVLETERAPLAVVLAVDVSGSMAGQPLEHALRRIVSDRLGPNDQLAIVTFSQQGRVVCGLTPLDAEGRDRIGASLRGVRAQSSTNLHEASAWQPAGARRAAARDRRAE